MPVTVGTAVQNSSGGSGTSISMSLTVAAAGASVVVTSWHLDPTQRVCTGVTGISGATFTKVAEGDEAGQNGYLAYRGKASLWLASGVPAGTHTITVEYAGASELYVSVSAVELSPCEAILNGSAADVGNSATVGPITVSAGDTVFAVLGANPNEENTGFVVPSGWTRNAVRQVGYYDTSFDSAYYSAPASGSESGTFTWNTPSEYSLAYVSLREVGGGGTGATMDAALSAVSATSASLRIGARAASSLSGQATVSAGLTVGARIAAAPAATASVTSSLRTGSLLASSLAGQASTSATVTTQIRALSSLSVVSSAGGTLRTGYNLQASGVATSQVSAALRPGVLLASSLQASGGVSGALQGAGQLSGSLVSQAGMSAGLTTSITPSAALQASSSVTGQVVVGARMFSTGQAQASVTAQLATVIRAGSALVAEATVQAGLRVGSLLSAGGLCPVFSGRGTHDPYAGVVWPVVLVFLDGQLDLSRGVLLQHLGSGSGDRSSGGRGFGKRVWVCSGHRHRGVAHWEPAVRQPAINCTAFGADSGRVATLRRLANGFSVAGNGAGGASAVCECREFGFGDRGFAGL